MGYILKNKNYKSQRVRNIESAAIELKAYVTSKPDQEFFEVSELFANCPLVNALKPLNDGEVDYLCSNADIAYTKE